MTCYCKHFSPHKIPTVEILWITGWNCQVVYITHTVLCQHLSTILGNFVKMHYW